MVTLIPDQSVQLIPISCEFIGVDILLFTFRSILLLLKLLGHCIVILILLSLIDDLVPFLYYIIRRFLMEESAVDSELFYPRHGQFVVVLQQHRNLPAFGD